MKVIRAEDRKFADFGWLKTHWLFSFDHYYDPSNVHFGVLRVFNDDWIAPQSGFGSHPHSEMEIVTIVLSGAVTHADSMGNQTKIQAGEVQRMSAGTGIVHSEHNREKEPLTLYQIWFLPYTHGTAPSYEQRSFDVNQQLNQLLPVVSGDGIAGGMTMNAEATVYLSRLEANNELIHPLAVKRGAFVYVTSGELTVNGETLRAQDQARITKVNNVKVSSSNSAEFILIDAKV